MPTQIYSLTKTQKRVWFNAKLSDKPIPNIALVFEIEGFLSITTLRKAIKHLVNTHTVLKSTIYSSNDCLERMINTAIQGDLEVTDFTQTEKEIDVFWLLQDITQTIFNLNTGPLFHFHLIKKNSENFYFVIVIHPIIVDRFSLKYLIESLSHYYNEEHDRHTKALDHIKDKEDLFDFNCIVELEKKFQTSEKYKQGLNHWLNTLKSNQFYLNLPKKSFFPTNDYIDAPFFEIFLNQNTRTDIVSFAHSHNIDYSSILLAVYQLLLYKYTGNKDVILNYSTPVSYTNQKVLGCLDNRLPFRLVIDAHSSFKDLIKQTHEQLTYDRFYKDIQINDIVKAIRSVHDTRFSGIFSNTSFDENYLPYDSLCLKNTKAHLISKFMKRLVSDNLALYYRDTGQEISLIADFDETIDHTAVKNLMSHYEVLLKSCLTHPDISLSEHTILIQHEYQQIIVDWNKTEEPYQNKFAHQLFEEQVKKQPDHIAAIYGELSVTYRELNSKTNQLAHYLKKFLDQKSRQHNDPLIGICLPRGLNMIISIFAILKAGAGYVPLDPQYPKERLLHILNDSGVESVISESNIINTLEFLTENQFNIICLDQAVEQFEKQSKENLNLLLKFSQLAYVIYTSGSTGMPKGVMIEHKSLPNLIHTYQKMFDITPQKRVLQFASMNFDAAVPEILGTLAGGASLYVVSEDLRQSPEALVKYLEHNEITTAMLPPALLKILPRHELPLLHTLAFGGDVCDQETVDYWARNREFLNVYGPTETTVYATYHFLQPGNLNNCIGKPIPNYTAYVLDKHLNPMPIGIPGELYIGGIGISRGYINRLEQTQKAFIINPFEHHDSNTHLHKTGDLVRYLPTGELEYIGRTDFEVKIRGFRILLSDIEHTLKTFSNITQVATKLWEHATLGKVIAVYYVLENYNSVTVTELREHMRKHLPEYMIPGYFVELEQMPMSISGKINKALLPNPFPQTSTDHVENNEEKSLKEVWCELFKLPPHIITENSDFFELGGHSLLATRLVSRLKVKFNIKITVKDIFHNSHFKQLAKLLKNSTTKQLKQLTLYSAPREDLYRPSYSQMRLWYFFKLMPQCPTYNIVFNIKFSNNIQPNILKDALITLLTLNDIFQTSFIENEGSPYLKIHQSADFDIPIIDCISQEEFDLELNRERFHTFDLSHFPLFHCKLLNYDNRLVFLFNVHHVLFDGGSLDIFMRTLEQIYGQLSKGQPASYIQPEFKFTDYAHSQWRWVQDGLFTSQLSYWQRKLSLPLPVLELPTDFKRPNELGFSGDIVTFSLPTDLVIQIKKLAVSSKCSLFSILLSVYSILLYRLTHQSDLIVASPIANRTQATLEQLIGLYLNIVVYRTQFKHGQTFDELLKNINNDVLDVQEHQDLPFDMIVNFAQTERDLSRNPIFQTMFILQNGFSLSGTWANSDITYEITEENTKTAKFDLTLVLYDQSAKDEISGFFEFNTALFRSDTILRYTQYFINILKAVSENVQTVIETIQFLPSQECTTLLHTWNQTSYEYIPLTIHDVFEKQVLITPNHTAVVCQHDCLTYKELNEKSNQYARYLKKFYQNHTGTEIQNNTIIGLCLDRQLDTIISILAILKVGAAYLPLDPDYPIDRLQYMLNDSQAPLLITKQSILKKLNFFSHQSQLILCLDTEKNNILKEHQNNLLINVNIYDLAYVIYTSGTTGMPKGVLIEHKSVPNLAVASHRMFEIQTNSRVLQFASINFDAAVWEIFSALLNGATLHVIAEEVRLSPEQLASYIDENLITFALLPPALLRVMPRKILPSLKTLAFGGDVCDHETRSYWSKNRIFFNAYGPTETTVCATWGKLSNTDTDNNIGQAVENFKLYVLDENLCLVPIGTYGELYIGGIGLARGYLNRIDLTVTRFIVNPFSDNPLEHIYKTGDIVRWLPNGTLEYLGRSDFQVKIRGFRIELTEIEAVLNQYPSIQQSIVNVYGENIHKQLIAYYVSKNSQSVSADELNEYLKTKLPIYMIPSAFIQIAHVPLSANGKIDRKSLPKPNALDIQSQNFYIAPRNATEEHLVTIWNSIFKYERIGVHDNFFALGGNSLLSMRLLAAVNKAFDCEMHLKEFFQNPTIEGIANYIAGYLQQSSTDMMALAKQDTQIRVLTENIIYTTDNNIPPRYILLTGANGFLGVHLLNELLLQTNAIILCLVRGSSQNDISEKMHNALTCFDLQHLIDLPRIHLIKGDLAKPNLGLDNTDWNFIASNCDTIYHNGASVNHVYDYQMLKQENVQSTIDIIQLAATSKPKYVNYISTLSVVNPSIDIDSETQLDNEPPSDSGYVLSKWVCEHLFQSASNMGLKVNILRPGNITGHSQTGSVAYKHNHALLLLKGCLQLGVAPRWSFPFDMMPVDYLSRAIVGLTLQNKTNFQIFNLANINTITWEEYFKLINQYGFNLNLISSDEWIEQYVKHLDENNALYPFKDYYLHSVSFNTSGKYTIKTINTRMQLERLNLCYPDQHDEQIKIYLDYLLKHEFISKTQEKPIIFSPFVIVRRDMH